MGRNPRYKSVVIGCGSIARGHLQAYRNIPELEIVAVIEAGYKSAETGKVIQIKQGELQWKKT